jgi:hypothetical protein
MHRARLGEVAGQQREQLVQVGAERAVGTLLDPEVLEGRDALGRRDPARRSPHEVLVDAARLRARSHRQLAQHGEHGLGAFGVLRDEAGVGEPFLHDRARERRQAPGVAAGADAQVVVGQLGGLGAHRVEHDALAARP